MIRGRSRPFRFRLEIALLLILVIGAMIVLWRQDNGVAFVGREAMSRVGIGQDLLNGEPRGRQGLIGSVRWAPLPTLLLMPLLRLPAPCGGNWAPVFVAVVVSAFLCAFLSGWLARCGVGWALRILMALAVFLSPALWNSCRVGSSEPFFLLFVLSTLCFLMHWWETGELRSLGYLSLSAALALIVRYETILLFLGVAGMVAYHLLAQRRPKHYREATLTIFLVPAVYVMGLWIASNWLIMGDPFFFVRGFSFWRRVGLQELRLFGDPYEWIKALLISSVALAAWRIRGLPAKLRPIWVGLPLLAIGLLIGCARLSQGSGSANTPLFPTSGYSSDEYADLLGEPRSPEEAELFRVIRHLAKYYRNDWIVYSGYQGYELSRLFETVGMKNFLHRISIYPEKLLEDTRGKRVFLLVPAPRGEAVWEDINVKYPDLFEHGACFAVFEYSWRSWLLVRLVRLDENEPPG